MAYKKDALLHNYDVYPKVFTAGKETEIHVRPLGGRPVFEPGKTYELVICSLDGGNPDYFPSTGDFRYQKVTADENGCFAFFHTFDSEQEYFLRFLSDEGKRLVQFPVYCVEKDLAGRYPFMGDLHMHTNLSDGSETPEVVAANYRKYGYDFTVISDHNRYYPSLRAIEKYKDAPISLNIVPGEEVHMPRVYGKKNDVHIVNFGGEFSVNALVEDIAVEEVGKDLKTRAIRENDVPDVMTMAEFEAKMQALADEIDVPEGIDRVPAAVCKWVFDQIKAANGLGIFPHPNWIPNAFHVPERFTDWLMETKPFDAFEVLGGESYYEHNGFQTARYYEERAKGNRFPIVGSTDSHGSYPELNPKGFICETIVFSPENERKALISSIKDYYSVAVDTISTEFRLVGEQRFIRYGCFLLKNYFPLHDDLCYEEGRLMKQYVTGTPEEREEALETLRAISGRTERLMKKYFAF
ncbi:MAG: hypothetical protein IJT27_01345 [Clostridia bacterium]|nr:hypothetical protein [Clostridia bacterium]